MSFDLIFLVIVLVFVGQALVRGFVASAVSLVGLVATVAVTLFVHPVVFEWLRPFVGEKPVWSIVAFAVLFLIVSQLVGYLAHAIIRVFRVISAIPFTKSIDRLLGGVFGLLEGVLFAGALTWFLVTYPVLPATLTQTVQTSWSARIIPWVIGAFTFFV
ncbi:CvpA family protein [Candidatus Uhrbacteria bacterium]|nr:CvpA family protein [Candidatus Uhrbacteria bacterium]